MTVYLCIRDAEDEEGLGRVAGINRIVYTGWVREYGLEHEDAMFTTQSRSTGPWLQSLQSGMETAAQQM